MFDLFKEKSVERNETFVDVFIKNAQKYPSKIALVDEDGSYTYHELNLISNGVATKLLKQGIGKGDVIPILMQRSKGFVAAFIGVLKSGAAFVPLDVICPTERINSITDSVNAKLTINDNWMNELPHIKESVNKAEVNEIAMIVFTSGSSGYPKGVVHTNRSLFALSKSVSSASCIHKDKRYANILSTSFIGGMIDYFACLFAGATIYIASENAQKDIILLTAWLTNNKITGFRSLPSVAKKLIEDMRVVNVEWIELLGDKVPPIINNSKVQLINHYGNSECGSCTYFSITNSLITPPIGRPISGMNAYILECDKTVPKGYIGELCFTGPQVAKGYWQLPELTAEKFVHCPFLPGNVIMYRTGDLARYREDGNIELVGRKDFQIKIRGYRIEQGEIENVATRFEGIDAVVVVAKELGNEKQLVLYYTSKAEIEEEQLKEHLSRFLADYMVPTFYVHLDEMPHNANGKIDRNALPAPALTIKDHISEEQITNIERSLLDEIKQELQIQDLGLDDDLLSVGFTSLSSMFVQTRLEQKGINFSSGGIEAYKVFLEFRTIRKVANYLENDNN